MKIFYAIQATGNGHIVRAMELVPYLQQYGQVNIFLSGSNSNLQIDLPVQYRSKGMSLFYGNSGGLDYLKMLKAFSPARIWKEAKDLPVEKYDVVLNDFESITSLACRMKKIPSVNFGHQASFQSNKAPRPQQKNIAGELVLKKYATAESYVGMHFRQYDDFIFNPVVKEEILKADAKDKGHITVYLSHYADETVAAYLKKIKDIRFEILSKKVNKISVDGNISFIPIHTKTFNESLIKCRGIITGAGFETPAEALYLGKKLLCIPIKGQYEQWCNAEALKSFNVPIVETIDEHFVFEIKKWMAGVMPEKLILQHSAYQIVQQVIETARNLKINRQDIQSNLLNKSDLVKLV